MSAPSSFLGQVFTRKLVAFAGCSLLIYDYLLTLSLEVTHIWNEPRSLVKSLFLINRYGNLIGQTFIMLEEAGYLSHGSRLFCIAFQLYLPVFSVFSGESIRLFVVMRTCAILGCKRRVTWTMSVLYILYSIVVVVFFTCLLLYHVDHVQFEYLDELGSCIAPFVPYPDLWMFWFIPLILDSCMLAIICYNCWRSTKEAREARDISLSPLIGLLLRDSCLFYIGASFSVVFAMICWTIYAQDPRNMLQTLISYPILSAVGQRLVLNLREYRSQSRSALDATPRSVTAAFGAERSSDGSDPGVEMDDLGTSRA